MTEKRVYLTDSCYYEHIIELLEKINKNLENISEDIYNIKQGNMDS